MTLPPPTARNASPLRGLAQSIASLILEVQSVSVPQGILRLDSRVILRLYSGVAVDLIRNALPLQALDNLLHSIKLQHSRVRNHQDFLRTQVSEIHPDFFRATRSETNGRCGHFKSVLFLLAQVGWRRE
jgi:hypothetical protein